MRHYGEANSRDFPGRPLPHFEAGCADATGRFLEGFVPRAGYSRRGPQQGLAHRGGDFDDKKGRISFKIKFRNGDPNRSFDGLKFELFVFGQSLVDKKAFKLLQRVPESFSLKPLQEFTSDSPEVVSAWDNPGAIFGEKYKGGYLVVKGPGGEVLVEKSVTAFLEGTAGLDGLSEGSSYDKKLKPLVVTP